MSANLRYFDYAATTPVDNRTIAAMVRCLGIDGVFGNPASSSHAVGLDARGLVEQSRAQVAALIGAQPDEIIWTSGATESNNLALKGFADAIDTAHTALGSSAPAVASQRRRLITSGIEHKAILDTAASLQARGFPVSYLMPDENGAIAPDAVSAALCNNTGLVSLMMVNNEIGTLTAVTDIAERVHAAGALLHVDAAQALGKVAIDVNAMGIDLMSMSAHKVYGPKGIGALYVRRDIAHRLATQMHGGGHERGLRSGTLATHQIVGMGHACLLAAEHLATESQRMSTLSRRLLNGLLQHEAIRLNASAAMRIPHTMSLTIDHPGFYPFMLTGDLALSSTSACNSAAGMPSHVLTALGLSAEAASRTIRISLGRFTTEEDIDVAIRCIGDVVEQCQV